MLQHGGEARGDGGAQFVARRIEQHGSEAAMAPGRPRCCCQAARPTPVPRQTSQARAMRWLSSGCSRAAVAGSASARRGMQRGGAEFGQQVAGLGAGGGAGIGDVGQALGQGQEIHARCRR